MTRPASYHPEGHLARRDSFWIPSQHTLDARFTRWCPKSHWGTSVLCGRSGTPRGYKRVYASLCSLPGHPCRCSADAEGTVRRGAKKAVKSDPGGTTQRLVTFEEPRTGSGSGLTALIARCSTPHADKDSPSSSGKSSASFAGHQCISPSILTLISTIGDESPQ